MTFGLRFPKHYFFVIHRAKLNENTLVNNRDMINISSKLSYEYTLVNVLVGGLCFISVWAVGGTPRWPSNLPRGAVKISCVSPLGGSQNSDLFLSRKSQPSTLLSTFCPLYWLHGCSTPRWYIQGAFTLILSNEALGFLM